MKRPAFQFYPGDWMRNAKLRRCSPAARGAWIDVLCLLHDSDEYGVLRWPLADIAHAAGLPVKLLKELIEKGVLKGADRDAAPYIYRARHAGVEGEPVELVTAGSGPCWYCSRFVRDEHVRQKRGGNTRFDKDNQPPKEIQKPAVDGTERARLRSAVLAKTGGYCHHCRCDLMGSWEIDHLIPRSKGGSNLFANLVPSCVQCNQDKADSMPDDWSPSRSPTPRVGDGKGVRQGDGASTSTSVKQEPHTARASTSSQMRLDWKPDVDHWSLYAKRSGITDADLTNEILIEFTNHWHAEGSFKTEAEWVNKLVSQIKYRKTQGATHGKTNTGDGRRLSAVERTQLDNAQHRAIREGSTGFTIDG